MMTTTIPTHRGNTSTNSNHNSNHISNHNPYNNPITNPIPTSINATITSASLPESIEIHGKDSSSNPQLTSKPKPRTGKSKKKPPNVILNLRDCRYRVLSQAVTRCGWGRSIANPITSMLDWDVYWTDSGIGIEHIVHIAKSYQRINHFPGMNSIYRKHHLAKSMARMQRCNPEEYDFFPKTWLLPDDTNDIRAFFKSQISNPKERFCIVKPAASCQGKGIYLIKKFDDIRPTNNKMVVQKYLQRPLLIDGLKFDLRVYVLVVSCEPLRILVHREGLVRFCTEPYSPPTAANMSCAFMHITNYAVNKANINFVQNNSRGGGIAASGTSETTNDLTLPRRPSGDQSNDANSSKTTSASTISTSPVPILANGIAAQDDIVGTDEGSTNNSTAEGEEPISKLSHKRSLSWLWNWMRGNGRDSEKLWQEICDLVVKTIISAQVSISHSVRTVRPDPQQRSPFGCFELLGFDILLQDEGTKPVLLEVNHTPSFKTDSLLDKTIKLQLLTDTLRLVNINASEKRRYMEKLAYLRTYGVAPTAEATTPAQSGQGVVGNANPTMMPSANSNTSTTRPSSASPALRATGMTANSASFQYVQQNVQPLSTGGTNLRPGSLNLIEEQTQKAQLKHATAWKKYLAVEGKRRGEFDLVYPADECLMQPTAGRQKLYDQLLYRLEYEREKEQMKANLVKCGGVAGVGLASPTPFVPASSSPSPSSASSSSSSKSGNGLGWGSEGLVQLRGRHAASLACSRLLVETFPVSSPRGALLGNAIIGDDGGIFDEIDADADADNEARIQNKLQAQIRQRAAQIQQAATIDRLLGKSGDSDGQRSSFSAANGRHLNETLMFYEPGENPIVPPQPPSTLAPSQVSPLVDKEFQRRGRAEVSTGSRLNSAVSSAGRGKVGGVPPTQANPYAIQTLQSLLAVQQGGYSSAPVAPTDVANNSAVTAQESGNIINRRRPSSAGRPRSAASSTAGRQGIAIFVSPVVLSSSPMNSSTPPSTPTTAFVAAGKPVPNANNSSKSISTRPSSAKLLSNRDRESKNTVVGVSALLSLSMSQKVAASMADVGVTSSSAKSPATVGSLLATQGLVTEPAGNIFMNPPTEALAVASELGPVTPRTASRQERVGGEHIRPPSIQSAGIAQSMDRSFYSLTGADISFNLAGGTLGPPLVSVPTTPSSGGEVRPIGAVASQGDRLSSREQAPSAPSQFAFIGTPLGVVPANNYSQKQVISSSTQVARPLIQRSISDPVESRRSNHQAPASAVESTLGVPYAIVPNDQLGQDDDDWYYSESSDGDIE